MTKKRAFHFCPACGQYCEAEPRGRSFVFVAAPRCPDCDRPIEATGFAFLLVGIVVCFPMPLILCAGATEAATGLFAVFMAMAVMRWGRQFNAKRKHAANQASQGLPRKLGNPEG
jgi:hypothetical protein